MLRPRVDPSLWGGFFRWTDSPPPGGRSPSVFFGARSLFEEGSESLDQSAGRSADPSYGKVFSIFPKIRQLTFQPDPTYNSISFDFKGPLLSFWTSSLWSPVARLLRASPGLSGFPMDLCRFRRPEHRSRIGVAGIGVAGIGRAESSFFPGWANKASTGEGGLRFRIRSEWSGWSGRFEHFNRAESFGTDDTFFDKADMSYDGITYAHEEHRDHRPRRPRKDDSRRQDAPAGTRFSG